VVAGVIVAGPVVPVLVTPIVPAPLTSPEPVPLPLVMPGLPRLVVPGLRLLAVPGLVTLVGVVRPAVAVVPAMLARPWVLTVTKSESRWGPCWLL
jgi:hypothetical protein